MSKTKPDRPKKPSGPKNKGVEPSDELNDIIPKKQISGADEFVAARHEKMPGFSETLRQLTEPAPPAEIPEGTFEYVALRDIKLSPTNPRTTYDDKKTAELAESVKVHGVIQPVLLRPHGNPGKYQLVVGSRRYKASELAGKLTIPATIRELTDDQALEIQIIENLQREGVNPIEEAVAYKNLMDLKGYDVGEVAHRLGKTPTFIAQRLKLNELIDDFKKLLFEERITITDALKVCKLKAEDQETLYSDEVEPYDNDHRVQIDDDMLRIYMYDLNDAPFDITDPKLSKLGACTTCRFNTASNSLLFPEGAGEARCTNTIDFKEKAELSFSLEVQKAHEDPLVILVTQSYNDISTVKNYACRGMKVYEMGQYKEVVGRNTRSIRGFIVNGHKKGKYIFIELITEKGKTTQAAAGDTNETRKLELQEQIDAIKSRETRKEELDFINVLPKLYEAFDKSGNYKNSDAEMTHQEKALAVIAISYDLLHSYSLPYIKWIKAPERSEWDSVKYYEWLKKQPEAQLDSLLIKALRVIMFNKIRPGNDDCPQKSGFMLSLLDTVEFYLPELHKKTLEDIDVARAKRKVKLDARIKDIKVELAALPAPEKKDHKTSKKK